MQGVYERDNSHEDFVVQDSSTVSLIQLEEKTVERDIVALDTQKGPEILKKIGLVVKRPLTILFNLSLLYGIFPCVWKKSNVVLLFKSGDKRSISNIRTIMEYIFYRRFLRFLKS
jgi:hypothetical protein